MPDMQPADLGEHLQDRGFALREGPTGMAVDLENVNQELTSPASLDIQVVNAMPCTGYVNVLMDWDQNGSWGGASQCVGIGPAPEHVLVNFPVPLGFTGPLSLLGPPPFLIGPKDQWIWSRFTITERPVNLPWDGSGSFEDGETEDYFLEVWFLSPVEERTWGCIKGLYR